MQPSNLSNIGIEYLSVFFSHYSEILAAFLCPSPQSESSLNRRPQRPNLKRGQVAEKIY